jgi:hypothetical protein
LAEADPFAVCLSDFGLYAYAPHKKHLLAVA